MSTDPHARVTRLLDRAGRTFVDEAGFTLRDKPSPLWQLVVLAITLAKPIGADLAVAAARELRRAGCTTPRRTLDLTWQQRVDALVRAHYRRFDESTSTRTAEAAQFVLDRWGGDLRRITPDVTTARGELQEIPGIGPAGADIVLREAQAVWPWARPFFDDRVRDGAKALGLPVGTLDSVVGPDDYARFAAALVRVTLDDDLAADVRGQSS